MMNKSPKSVGFLGIGLMFLVLAVQEFLSPTTLKPQGGRWDWFFGILWDIFEGNLGIKLYWTIFGLIFVLVYILRGK